MLPWVMFSSLLLSANGQLVVNSTGDEHRFPYQQQICDTDAFDNVTICTLRAAIETANLDPDVATITFNIPTTDPGYNAQTHRWTINLDSPLPNLSTPMNITGPGAKKITIQRAIDASAFSIFFIPDGITVTLSGLTISNGATASGSAGGGINNHGITTVSGCVISGNSAGGGGGISNFMGPLTITNCTISGNSASRGGGLDIFGQVTITNSVITNNAAGIGGGLYAETQVTVRDTTFSNNSAASGGGAFLHGGGTLAATRTTFSRNSGTGSGGAGGAIFNQGHCNLTDCMLSNNKAVSAAGAIYANPISENTGDVTINGGSIIGNSSGGDAGGVYIFAGQAQLTNATISGNSANQAGGGMFCNSQATVTVLGCTIDNNKAAHAGAILNSNSSTLSITSSTIANNSALTNDGGAIQSFDGTLNLSNSTVSGNSAANSTGGIQASLIGSSPKVTVKSSIIARNTAASEPDVSGQFASAGYNLVGITDGSAGFGASTDLLGTEAVPRDPKLDSNGLRDNGGPTRTIALLSSSAAIDKGTSNALTATLTTDQRGVGYKRTIEKSITDSDDGTDIGAFEFGAKLQAVSRKKHGSGANFDIDLYDAGTNLGVECRDGGALGSYTIIFTFPSAIGLSSVDVTPDRKVSRATALVSGYSVNSTKATVDLTKVSNAQTILVNLRRVTDGTTTNDISVPMGVLVGDADGDRSVTDADVTLTQSKVSQTLNKTNFREDVTVDGMIDANDVNRVVSNKGTALP